MALQHNELFTFATFVSETVGDSDTRQSATVLALATLGDATQIGSYLFTLRHPRWPRKVRKVRYRWHYPWRYRAKFCQCKHSLMGLLDFHSTNKNVICCNFKHSSFCTSADSKPILNAKGRLLASPTNIRLDWKGLPRANTLAYYENS